MLRLLKKPVVERESGTGRPTKRDRRAMEAYEAFLADED
jgi:hypothetical protein